MKEVNYNEGFSDGCLEMINLLKDNPIIKEHRICHSRFWMKYNIGAKNMPGDAAYDFMEHDRGKTYSYQEAVRFCKLHHMELPTFEDVQNLDLKYITYKNSWDGKTFFNSRRFESTDGVVFPLMPTGIWMKKKDGDDYLYILTFKFSDLTPQSERTNIYVGRVTLSLQPVSPDTVAYLHPCL